MILRLPKRIAAARPRHPYISSPSLWPFQSRLSSTNSPSTSSSPTPPQPADTKIPRVAQPTGQGTRLSFWPFLFIFLLSSGSYVLIVKRRVGESAAVSPENRRKAHTER